MTLERWGLKVNTIQRPAKLEDVEPLYNTFQRIRKLNGIAEKFSNVILKFALRKPVSAEEWALVVELKKEGARFRITAVPLGTAEKGLAVRRAWGWGLKDEDGNVIWPPEVEL